MKIKLLLLFLFFAGMEMNAQIRVNDANDPETNLTAEELIQDVLISGDLDCVDIELVNLQENPTGVSNLAQRSWGYFNNDGGDFPFEEGIVLTSGYAVTAEGPNSSTASGGGTTAWAGDMDLETILNNQYSDDLPVDTNNATVFEFTFTSALDEVAFDFIFASEEYEDQFECSNTFRDGFAFLISGPGIADDSGAPFGGSNIAQVPNSNNVPVDTRSIHADYFLCGDEVQNQDYFPLYYVSNSGVDATDEHEYDGRTISLTARADIIPGEEYTMKLVIADRGDSSYDSAVFFRAGSFDIGDADLGGNVLLADGDANCEGDAYVLSAGANVSSATYVWYRNGTEMPGETGNTLEVFDTATYSVEIFYSATCTATDSVIVEFFPNPEIDLGPDTLVCPDAPVTLDGTPLNEADLSSLTYAWYKDGALQSGNSSTFAATEEGVYMVEVTTDNGCTRTDEIVLTGVDFEVDLGDPISPCGVESYEIVPDITMISGGDPATATYVWSTGEETQNITVTEDGEYWVDVTIEGCTLRETADVLFREIPTANLGEDFSKCNSDVATIDATPTNLTTPVTYTWFHDGTELTGNEFTGAVIEVTDPGTYSVEIDNDGCPGTAQVTVSNYPIDNCIVPEAISPNGDNVNDCVDLQFLSDELGIENFKLYNRHGRLIFDQNDYVSDFCGNDQDGNELPTGTYYYVMNLNNTNQMYDEVETGWIYINREN